MSTIVCNSSNTGITYAARERDARVQHDTELSDSEDEGTGGRRHRQNYNELQNAINGKRKGKATQSPTGTLPKRSKRVTTSNSPATGVSRDVSLAPSGSQSDVPAVTGDGSMAVDAPRVVSTGAIVPNSALGDGGQMDVDPQVDAQAVDAELQTEITTGQIDDVGMSAKELSGTADAPVATPQTTDKSEVFRPPAFAPDSILPVGKHASEVGELTPEPSTDLPKVD